MEKMTEYHSVTSFPFVWGRTTGTNSNKRSQIVTNQYQKVPIY